MGLLIVLGRCLIDEQFRQDILHKKPGTLKNYWLTDQECGELLEFLNKFGERSGEIPIPPRWKTLSESPPCCQNPPC